MISRTEIDALAAETTHALSPIGKRLRSAGSGEPTVSRFRSGTRQAELELTLGSKVIGLAITFAPAAGKLRIHASIADDEGGTIADLGEQTFSELRPAREFARKLAKEGGEQLGHHALVRA
jgi:hypothetical protein